MTLSASQQTQLEGAVARIAYFTELQFVSGTVYFCNCTQNYTWNSIEWLGLGQVGSIGGVTESARGHTEAMEISLNISSSVLRGLSLSDPTDYRGQPAKVYFCPLDEGFALVGTPQLCWSGRMDIVTLGVSGDSGQIVIQCENSANGLKRRNPLRIGAVQQKARGGAYATDTGFDHLNALMGDTLVWLTKKFQGI